MTTSTSTLTKAPTAIAFNKISVSKLFKKYESIGFIYPEKKVILQPYWSKIKSNWKKLLQNPNDLLWILTTDQQQAEKFASVSVIKQGNYGLLAQHLVSEGNPFLSLKVMLAAQHRAEHSYNEHEVKSSQNWFRPNNRYAFRVFASMLDRLGSNKANLRAFQYLLMPLKCICQAESDKYYATEIQSPQSEFLSFIENQYGRVFIQGEELDQEDLMLKKLNALYQKSGLQRKRRIILIKSKVTNQVTACIIANRAPLGLNFSFLENRAYYIVGKNMNRAEIPTLLKFMNSQIKSFYRDLALGAIPIVTDLPEKEAFEKIKGAQFIRSYMQSIWLREGFSEWYAHIQAFLQRIEGRMRKDQAA